MGLAELDLLGSRPLPPASMRNASTAAEGLHCTREQAFCTGLLLWPVTSAPAHAPLGVTMAATSVPGSLTRALCHP